jgi:hypothetical protein
LSPDCNSLKTLEAPKSSISIPMTEAVPFADYRMDGARSICSHQTSHFMENGVLCRGASEGQAGNRNREDGQWGER